MDKVAFLFASENQELPFCPFPAVWWLVETRILLELKSSSLAALRRTDADLVQMKNALEAYKEKVLAGEDAVQEDLLFHLAIAKAVEAFTNSDGCKLKIPKLYQDVAPLMFFPNTNKPTKKRRPIMYSREAYFS